MAFRRTSVFRLWRRWVSIVQQTAHARPLPADVSPRRYVELHRRLLAECERYRQAHTGDSAAIVIEMMRLASPWINLETLFRADRGLLADICRRCAALDRVRQSFQRGEGRPGLKAAVMLAAIVGLLGGAFWAYGGEVQSTGDLLYGLRRHWWSLQGYVAGSGREMFYAAAVLLVMVFGWLLYGTRES